MLGIGFIKRKLIKGAQKAVVAGCVAAAAVIVARVPELAPVLSEENVSIIAEVAITLAISGVSGLVGYGLTWWKANRS